MSDRCVRYTADESTPVYGPCSVCGVAFADHPVRVPSSWDEDRVDALARAREAVATASGALVKWPGAEGTARAAAWAAIGQAWAGVGRLELECMAAFPSAESFEIRSGGGELVGTVPGPPAWEVAERMVPGLAPAAWSRVDCRYRMPADQQDCVYPARFDVFALGHSEPVTRACNFHLGVALGKESAGSGPWLVQELAPGSDRAG